MAAGVVLYTVPAPQQAHLAPSAPPARRALRRPRRSTTHRAAPSRAARALGLPPVPRGPVPGYVLIADRNANKLLIVLPSKQIVWQFPRAGDIRRGQSFTDPDDAFLAPGDRQIVTNEEFNDQVAQIDLRTHRLNWTYGRAGVAGSAAGELSNPDDAYAWPDGTITVADIKNCRIVRINRARHVTGEVGGRGCAHDPPRSLASPNGATPLPDGGMLVTEIGGWVDRMSAKGRLLYSLRTPTSYPSDAQLLPNGDILVAGFNTPGRVDEITPGGRVVWTYGPASGPGALDRPSLAVRWPNGMIAITDDWHHRIVVLDPKTKRIVWQYGHFGIASAAPGYLSKPDGLDLLPAAGRSHRRARARASAGSGRLPAAASRLAAVAAPGRPDPRRRWARRRRFLDERSWPDRPGGFGRSATLPAPDARRRPSPYPAARGLLFGGGEAVSTDAVGRASTPRTGHGAPRGDRSDEPLSDLGAVVRGAKRSTSSAGTPAHAMRRRCFASDRAAPPALVTRLPAGLRYAGVAALDGKIYVAGGVTPAGESDSVFVVDPARRTVQASSGRFRRPSHTRRSSPSAASSTSSAARLRAALRSRGSFGSTRGAAAQRSRAGSRIRLQTRRPCASAAGRSSSAERRPYRRARCSLSPSLQPPRGTGGSEHALDSATWQPSCTSSCPRTTSTAQRASGRASSAGASRAATHRSRT